MEVLISVFVISIGLLGIVALIPVANYALMETSKADRTAACGQAAKRDVRVRRLVELIIDDDDDDDDTESDAPASNPFAALFEGHTLVVDPLRFVNGETLGDDGETLGDVLRRSHLHTQARLLDRSRTEVMGREEAERIFYWHDDLLFDMDEASEVLQYDASGNPVRRVGDWVRPRGFRNSDGVPTTPMPEGSYSWFFTVSPLLPDTPSAQFWGWRGRRYFAVSVAVCHGRDVGSPDDPDLGTTELSVGCGVIWTRTPAGAIISGVQLAAGSEVDVGQWVLLRGGRFLTMDPDEEPLHLAQWYRVTAGAGLYYSLEGPPWPVRPGTGEPEELSADNTELIVVPDVVGVYTTTVDIYHSLKWFR